MHLTILLLALFRKSLIFALKCAGGTGGAYVYRFSLYIECLLVFIRDRPIYRPGQYIGPICKFHQYIGIGQNGQFYQPLVVDKMLLYSSHIQTTCVRKHYEPSQDSYLASAPAGGFS